MKRTFGALLLAVLVATASSGSAASFDGPPRATQMRLANGLRVVVVENHTLPLAQVAMWYGIGSADDPPGRHGLAHALEHMAFSGMRELPERHAIDRVAGELGMETNAETDFEFTYYTETVPLDELAVAFRIEAIRMHGLLLRPNDWTVERRAILAELGESQSHASDALQSAVRLAAYGESPYGFDQTGTRRDLFHIGVADLRRAYDAAYAPDNATLVVTGDVAPAAVFALARQYFAPLGGRARIVHAQTETPVSRGFFLRVSSVDTRVVDVALESHGDLAPDAAAETVAAELLGPEHTALRGALIDDGPCSSYHVVDDTQLHGGLYHLICDVDSDASPSTAVRAIRAALRRLAMHPPAKADIGYARRAALAGGVYARDSLSAEADLFGSTFALYGSDPRDFDTELRGVSEAAVAAVLRRWVHPIGIAVAAQQTGPAFDEAPIHRSRGRHVVPGAAGDTVQTARWTRFAPSPLRRVTLPAVEAFALPNGVRVFVEPRRGNGTVYLRGGFSSRVSLDDSRRWPPARIARVAEQHSMSIDVGTETNMHGFARDLPTMLAVLAGVWTTSPRTGRTPPSPEESWIAVTGDVDASAVRDRVTRLFAGWKPAPSAPRPSPSVMVPRAGGDALVDRVSMPSVSAILFQRAPERSDSDADAMTLLAEILGAGDDFDARLMHEMRTRRGLVYSVGSEYDAHRSMLAVWFDCAPRDFRAAHAAVTDVVESLQTRPVSAPELARARRKLVAEALRNETSPDGVLDRLGAAATERRAPDDLDSLAARYDAVSVADLRRVARTWLSNFPATEIDRGLIP